MPKNKRRTRQKQDADFTDTHGSLRTTKHSHSKRPHLKGKNSLLFANALSSIPGVKDGHCGSEAWYDAAILHSRQEGETALKVKRWLEQNLSLQFGDDHKHPPKIELMGNIDPNYVTSLETASKRTKTIIILCTKYFDKDVLFRSTVNALWTFKSVQDFQIVPLLFDFGEEESPPESIPVIDAHILRFETESEYFKDTIKTRLSYTRLQQEKTRGTQHGRREGKDGYEQRPLHPSAGTSNDDGSQATTRQQSYEDDPEATLPPETNVRDSGVGYSIPCVLTDHWSLQYGISFSGPPGLPHTPCVHSVPTVSSSPGAEESPQNPSATSVGAVGSSLLVESITHVPVLQSENDCEGTHRDEDERTETKSEADKEQRASKSLPVSSSTTVPKKEINSESRERDRASHTEESGALTTRLSSGQLTTPSDIAEHQQYRSGPSFSTMNAPVNLRTVVNHSRAQRGGGLKETPDPSTSSLNKATDLVSDSCLDVDQNRYQDSRVKPGKSDQTTGKDVQRDGHLSDFGPMLVTPSTDPQSQMTFETSNSGSDSEKFTSSKDMKPPIEDSPDRVSADDEEYLTPCSSINHCDDCHKANEPQGLGEHPSCYYSLECEVENHPDTESFQSDKTRMRVVECHAENAQKRQPEIKTERLNLRGAPATKTPPVHSYANADPGHRAISSSMVLPPHMYISMCNQSPPESEETAEAAVVEDADDGYNTAGTTASSEAGISKPISVNIYRANSVVIIGTECLTHTHHKPSTQAGDTEMGSDDDASSASTTYQTWQLPCNAGEADHPHCKASEGPNTDVINRRLAARGPQPPPRRVDGFPANYASPYDYQSFKGSPSYYQSSNASPSYDYQSSNASPTTTTTMTKKKKSRFALFSSLRALMVCCTTANKSEDGDEVHSGEKEMISPEISTDYEEVEDIYAICEPTVREIKDYLASSPYELSN